MLPYGTIIPTAFISPFREEREKVRGLMPHGDFLEIRVDCLVEVCESRDVKGLYKRARAGEVKEFTGISALPLAGRVTGHWPFEAVGVGVPPPADETAKTYATINRTSRKSDPAFVI